MALPSYMSRREGRYYLQVRLARPLAALIGVPLYRASLRTCDYRQARLRLAECLAWIYRMNDSVDYPDLIEKNVAQLRIYLSDAVPFSEERLLARRHYEELLKNLTRRAEAQGWDIDMLNPDYRPLFKRFVWENTEVEAWHKRAEGVRQYERGRADMQMALAFGAVPQHVSTVPAHPRELRNRSTYPAEPFSISAHDTSTVEPHGFGAGHLARPEERDQPTDLSQPSPTPRRVASVVAPQPLTDLEADEVERRDEGAVGIEHRPEPQKAPLRFSEALAAYEEADIRNKGNADARSIVKLIVQFIIDKLGDPLLADFDKEAAARLDAMLPDIPDRKNIPREHTVSLAARYDYAQEHGWTKLKRLTEARLRNGYHNALSRFFDWLIGQKLYLLDKPEFSRTSDENLVSIERDAFSTDEVRKIFSLPLFTGCESAKRMWVKGDCLVQNHLYWGYVMSFLTGVRPGELGQIELGDIEAVDGIYYLQLRGFDPKKGRVARKDVKRFKTQASHRTIPLHPLILDLGLLDRIEDLRSIGCPVLFPEWQPYPKPNGEMRWGQPLTKSFQYLKEKVGIDRFDVSLYSSRHWFADLIDNSDIKDATRRRLMGHSGKADVASRYGRKRRLTNRDLGELTMITSSVIDEMARLLLNAKERADAGELTVLKPWLTQANWSPYYKTKFGRK